MPKISLLPAGVALTGAELVPVVQGGVTVEVPASFFNSSVLGAQRVVVGLASTVAAATESLLVIKNAAPANIQIFLGTVASRAKLPLTIVDFNGNATIITVTPSGAETIMGLANWQAFSGGAGLGSKLTLVPVVDALINGWVVTVG